MAAEKRWTFKQKVALSKALEKLPENEHEHIYRIIKAIDPDTLEDCPGGTSIQFNLLRPQTLRELEGLIASSSVNTQSEIQENNPVEHEKGESSSTSNTRKSPRSKESEIEENKSAEHEKEEGSSKSTSNTRKSPRGKCATGSSEETGEVSIKTRLRRTSRKSEASHSK